MSTEKTVIGMVSILLVIAVAVFFYTGGGVGIFVYTSTSHLTLIVILAVIAGTVALLYSRRKGKSSKSP